VNFNERTEFLLAMVEASNTIASVQAALQRAQRQCHGEIYDHVELMSRRLYELRIKSDWLRYAALEKVELPLQYADGEGRQGVDRRLSLDRRIISLRKQLLEASA